MRTFPRSDLFKRGSTREFYFYSAKKAVCDCPVVLTKGVVQEASQRYQGLYRKYIRAKEDGATHKIWQASGGVNSRRSHNQINGLEIKIDEYFSINGAKLFLPNDPKAPIDETANCDCDVRYVKRENNDRCKLTESVGVVASILMAQGGDSVEFISGRTIKLKWTSMTFGIDAIMMNMDVYGIKDGKIVPNLSLGGAVFSGIGGHTIFNKENTRTLTALGSSADKYLWRLSVQNRASVNGNSLGHNIIIEGQKCR